MKKKYIQPSAEFEEIEESLLYQPSIKGEATTKENTTEGPTSEEGSSEGGWFND